MKKDIIKLLGLLLFGAAALSGCSIENRAHRGYNHDKNDRYHHDRDHDDNHNGDHHYNNYR